MKKFFEKHDLVKIALCMIVLTVILSWIIPQGYFNAGELVKGEITRVGLFDFVTYGLLGMYYFTVLVTFFFVLGAFYQFLSKLGAYQKLTDKIAAKVKGKEILFSLIISFIFAALASMVNEYLVLVAFMPFIITICSKLKMDKISTFVTTFGAMLVGILGTTISAKVAGMSVQYLSLTYTDNLFEKTAIFAIAFIIYSLFNIRHLKKTLSDNKEFKTIIGFFASFVVLLTLVLLLNVYNVVLYTKLSLISLILNLFVLVTSMAIFKKASKPVWAVFVPIYNIYVTTKIAGLRWYYVILYFVPIVNIFALLKIFIGIAKKFNKSTGFGVGMCLLSFIFMPILALDESSYEKKKSTKAKAVNEEKIIVNVDLFENTVKGSDKSNTIPLIIVGIIAILVTIMAYIPWSTVFQVDWFTKALTAVTEAKLFGVPIFSYILGNVTEFGSWDIFGVQVVMILAMIVLAICYKQGLTSIIDSFAEGFKKSSKLVVVLLLAYVILEFTVMYPVIPTILGSILGDKFNVLTTTLCGLLTSAFTTEYQYTINLVYSYLTSAYASNLSVVSIILQSTYGLVSFFVPSSAMLLVGLSYLDIPYKDWMKYIWKFLVAMLVVIIVMAFIIA